jgi:uncharacterized membrane protein YhaH (DUF805 family)
MRQNNDEIDKQKGVLTPVISALLSLFSLPVLNRMAWAQRPMSPQPGSGAACAACGGCGIFMIIIPVAIIALNIALLVWVARDAKSRGMDSAVLWMVLVMFTSLIGLLIYIFSRPQGNLVQCASCHNQRLQASAKCPHCGNP